MNKSRRNMKLKVRAAILSCSVLSFCAIFIAIHELPTLPDRKVTLLSQYKAGRSFEELEDQPHIFTFRKRLNKSNYTSENISPDIDKPPAIVSTVTNETVEYIKEKDESIQGDNHFAEEKAIHNKESAIDVRSNESFNSSDPAVDKLIYLLQTANGLKFGFEKTKDIPYYRILRQIAKRTRRKGIGLPIYRNYYGGSVLSNWERFHKGIHQHGLYSGEDPAVDGILEDLVQEQIVDIEMKEGGTQLKLLITYSDEGQALFKPMRYPRTQETLPDHFYFVDFERHNAEIAAFHLDRILGFYRVPPTAGREVNLTQDIRRLAEPKLKKTFFISPANNVCFHGTCSYYCDTSHAICGHPEMAEGSFATFLPPERIAPRKTWRNPWKRSYSKLRKAYWEVYDDLCQQVQQKEPYNSGRRLLDIIDMHIFDFLTDGSIEPEYPQHTFWFKVYRQQWFLNCTCNMDRHHYETFVDFGNETFLLHLDNGRAFGKSGHDEMSILTPLYQCCMIRYTTFIKLVKFYLGPETLSILMRQSMKRDVVNPILTESHLVALDRRVMKILKAVHECIEYNPYTDVIVDDFF